MLDKLDKLDSMMLAVTFWLLKFCVEWLSLSQRYVERGLIVVYAVLIGVGGFFGRRFEWETSWVLWFVPVFLLTLVVPSMWREHRRTDAERVVKMLGVLWMVMRTSMFFWIIPSGVILLLPPRRWYDALSPLAFAAYIAFSYATSLPQGGEPGRKRKLALAKLKEMFGTSWMPAPQPVP